MSEAAEKLKEWGKLHFCQPCIDGKHANCTGKCRQWGHPSGEDALGERRARCRKRCECAHQ